MNFQTTLIDATDAHFAWMLGEMANPDGLCLPAGGVDEPSTLAMLRALAASQRTRCRPGTWLIVVEGEVVGLCGCKGAAENGVAEIGFGIATDRRRHGYGTQAVAQLLTTLASNPEITEVAAETVVGNRASQRVLQSNGFLQAGSRRDPVNGELIIWRRVVR
jgi:ribosomal-protein-alanine N-acetyltransferase